MRVGLLLPTFRESAEPALDAARRAREAGLDGVFTYDHLFPIGGPDRPCLAPFPVLAAVAAREPDLLVGPLVARVGLVSTAALLEQFAALEVVAPGRVIAALGTGDRLSRAENLAFGLPYGTADERRALLAEAAASLRARHEVWVGAGSAATAALARSLGATLNLWQATPAEVAAARADGPVCWSGEPADDLEGQLDALEGAGATFAVLAPSADPARLGRWRGGHRDAQ